MGTLFGALNSSLTAIQAFQTALNISQNNVSNASTPGYARQVANLEALPFDASGGLTGGVKAGPAQSTQNEYADQAVRTQLSQQGSFSAQSTALASIQGLFDVSGQTGIVGALNNLFQSFSGWSADPGSTSAQQTVLTSAQALAQSFQSTAASLSQTTVQLNQQIGSTVQQINQIASQIQADNVAILKNPNPGGGVDPGVSANLEASLESLSQLADVTVTFASDGTATVLLGGQNRVGDWRPAERYTGELFEHLPALLIRGVFPMRRSWTRMARISPARFRRARWGLAERTQYCASGTPG